MSRQIARVTRENVLNVATIPRHHFNIKLVNFLVMAFPQLSKVEHFFASNPSNAKVELLKPFYLLHDSWSKRISEME